MPVGLAACFYQRKGGKEVFKRNHFSDTSSCGGVGLNFFTDQELDMIHCGTLEV